MQIDIETPMHTILSKQICAQELSFIILIFKDFFTSVGNMIANTRTRHLDLVLRHSWCMESHSTFETHTIQIHITLVARQKQTSPSINNRSQIVRPLKMTQSSPLHSTMLQLTISLPPPLLTFQLTMSMSHVR